MEIGLSKKERLGKSVSGGTGQPAVSPWTRQDVELESQQREGDTAPGPSGLSRPFRVPCRNVRFPTPTLTNDFTAIDTSASPIRIFRPIDISLMGSPTIDTCATNFVYQAQWWVPRCIDPHRSTLMTTISVLSVRKGANGEARTGWR